MLYAFATYAARTPDEDGYATMFRSEDGIAFAPEVCDHVRHHNNINNCDIDLCEFEGKTHIYYLTGNQGSIGIMWETLYDGPMNEFLKAFFK